MGKVRKRVDSIGLLLYTYIVINRWIDTLLFEN